jgi:CHAT domain-containing protein/tetratricopeptide (TPR) repeat protein
MEASFEEIARIFPGAGPYRVEVRLSGDTAANRYRLELLTVGPPTDEDRVRDRADRLVEQITACLTAGTKESREKGLALSREIDGIWRGLDDSFRVVMSGIYGARFAADLGDHAAAIAELEKLLPLALATGVPQSAWAIHNEIGRYQNRLGESQKAIEHFREALRLNAAAGVNRETASMQNNLSLVYRRLGQFPEALAQLQEALALAKKFGNLRVEGEILNNIGVTYMDLGDNAKALEVLKRVPEIRRETHDREGESNALYNLGHAYYEARDYPKARQYYEEALPIVREVGSRYGEGFVLTALGEVCDRMGDSDRALSYLEEALPVRRGVGDLDGEASVLRTLATVQRRMGRLPEARASVEAALARYELLRGNVASPARRASYFLWARPAYDVAIEILMEMHGREPGKGFDAAALGTSERARARSLVEMLSEANVDFRQGVDPGLLGRETDLRNRLRDGVEKQLRLAAEKPGSPEAAAADRAVESIRKDVEETDSEIRVRSPRFSALAQDRPLPLDELRALLGPETVLLEYALTPDHAYVWAVDADGLRSAILPSEAEIEKTARRLYEAFAAASRYPAGETPETRRDRLARSRKEARAAADSLSKTLLDPVAPSLGRRRVVIVAEGALLFVPFGALPFPGAPAGETLISRHEVATLPSASLLAVIRRGAFGRARPKGTIAMLADPVFDAADARITRSAASASAPVAGSPTRSADDPVTRSAEDVGFSGGRIPRLAFARHEAQAILALAPAGTSRRALDFDASLATAVDPAIGRYRLVHFATHGLINSAHPELSGIVLSLVDRKGAPRPGFLTSSQIYGLYLPADVVVLSGCQTALGKEIRGEGLIGLTSGFLHAGAKSVVSSLWKVDDEATAELMTAFYRGILSRGMAPSAALTASRRELRGSRRWSDPFYWAGFVFQGDWSTAALPESRKN